MSILTEIRADLRELIMPLLGQEIPLAVTEVNEALAGDDKRPQLHQKKKTALGWDFWFVLPPDITFREFAGKAEYFRDHIGPHCTVEVLRAGKLALLRVVAQQLRSRYPYDWGYSRAGTLPIPIGYTHTGLIVVDLADIPHLLIGGITGGGKSNAIHVLVNSLLPTGAQIILVDLKMSEYTYLEQHVLLVTDQEAAGQVIRGLVAEMRRRQQALKAARCVNIAKYNCNNPADLMKYIVLIIDELAELTDEAAQDDVETLLRLCRASGICLVAATQRPDANTFKRFGQSKANFRGRLCFQVADAVNSRIILDNGMAADLPDCPGRAIWRLGKDCVEVQTPYLDPEEAEVRLP